MAFKDKVFNGYAKKFVIGNKIIKDVFLELDIKNKEFNIYFPSDSFEINKKLSADLKEILKKDVYIKEAIILLPNFSLYAKKIENIFISQYKPSGIYIGETFLSNSFGLTEINSNNLYGFDKVSITSKKIFFQFELRNGKFPQNYREILIENFYIELPSPPEFRRLYSNYGILLKKPSENLVSIILSEENKESLESVKKAMKLALSYIQGLNVADFMDFDGKNIRFHLLKSNKSKNLFRIIPYNWIEEFIIAFYRYWLSLSKNDKEKLEMLILNLVYGKTKKMIIDSQLSHLMLVIEIIAKGKVEKNRLKEKLDISSYDARFIVELRNKILHGFSFMTAINYAFEKAKNEKDKEKSLFYSMQDKWKGQELIIKVYLGILYYLDKYLLNLINYNGKWFNSLNEFSEEYVNEILLEDKDLLKELKNR